MDIRFRPLPVWPHPPTPAEKRRSQSVFSATWSATLDLLERELRHLDADDVIVGAGLAERDIRLDGWPRADARWPSHPGVELSFSRGRGGERLVYATDVCAVWQHNVRSIALGLEALRAVDRYGITRRGEQYAGFRAITTGGPELDDIARGRQLIERYGSVQAALRATHPDVGGDRADLEAVLAARSATAGDRGPA